jgi:hypothetical protein
VNQDDCLSTESLEQALWVHQRRPQLLIIADTYTHDLAMATNISGTAGQAGDSLKAGHSRRCNVEYCELKCRSDERLRHVRADVAESYEAYARYHINLAELYGDVSVRRA